MAEITTRRRVYKLRKVGDSLVVTLPQELATVLGAADGDFLLWSWTDGSSHLVVELADWQSKVERTTS